MISGIDVSSFQPKPRWDMVRAAGAEFAIIKVTEGNGYANPKATEQVAGALAEGLLVALYHFARPNGPDWIPDAHAEGLRLDQIADVFEQKHGRKFFCFLDVERNEPLSLGERPLWRVWANQFRTWCRNEGKRPIGWYSFKDFTEQLELDAEWTTTLLWLARYPKPFLADCSYVDANGLPAWAAGRDALDRPTTKCPKPWARADIWQHGGDANGATFPGIDGPCDVNSFAGSREELQALIDVAA